MEKCGTSRPDTSQQLLCLEQLTAEWSKTPHLHNLVQYSCESFTLFSTADMEFFPHVVLDCLSAYDLCTALLSSIWTPLSSDRKKRQQAASRE